MVQKDGKTGFYQTSKAHYKRRIFQMIYQNGPVSRYGLAELLNIRYTTLQRLLGEMLREQLVRESGNVVIRRGRAPILLTVNPEGGRFVGIALGAREITGVLLGLDMTVLRANSVGIDQNATRELLLQKVLGLVRRLCRSREGKAALLRGIGFGEYGLLDIDEGKSLRSTYHRHWRDVPTQQLLEKRFRVPVAVDGGERCALLAEHVWGSARNARTALLMEVEEGIGFAVLHRGQLFAGSRGFAGEIGHIQMVPDGDICLCGSQGCLETVASNRAILAEARRCMLQGIPTELPSRRPGGVTVRGIVQAAMNGDNLAQQIMSRAVSFLGGALGIAVNLYNPDAILLRGEMFQAGGDWLIDNVRREAGTRSLRELKDRVCWQISKLDYAAARGACARIFETLYGFDGSTAAKTVGTAEA